MGWDGMGWDERRRSEKRQYLAWVIHVKVEVG